VPVDTTAAGTAREAPRGLQAPLRPWSSGWVLVGVGLPFGALLADFMAVSVALPALERATGASFSQLLWVLEAYLLAFGAFLLASPLGRPHFSQAGAFLLGSAALAAGAGLAGAAPDLPVLIVARAIEGAGSAFVLSAGPLLLASAFGPGQTGPGGGRGGALPQAGASPGTSFVRLGLASWPVLAALSAAAAPVVGGALTGELGWRYLFYAEAAAGAAGTVALALLALRSKAALVALRSKAAHFASAEAGPPDWTGASLLTAAVAIGVVGLVRTTYNLENWLSSGVVACLACTGLLLVASVAQATATASPALPAALFRRGSFVGACTAAFGLGMATMGLLPLLAFYLAYALGYGPVGTGLRLLALSGMALPGVGLGALATKWLPVRQPSGRWLLAAGLALVAAGWWLSSQARPSAGWGALWPGLVVAGAGYEMASARLVGAATAGLPVEQAPLAARTASMTRQFGAASGVALCASVFAAKLTSWLAQRLGPSARLSGEPPALAALLLQGHLLQADHQAGAAVAKAALAAGLHEALLAGALVAAACALVALLAGSGSLGPLQALLPSATSTAHSPAAPTKHTEQVPPKVAE
jgi:MFS family permease